MKKIILPLLALIGITGVVLSACKKEINRPDTSKEEISSGAFSNASTIAGINNKAELYLHNSTINAIVVATHSVPTEPASTNVVHLFR